jgi:DNA polymerase-3 subunit gamma/tau
MNMTTLYRKYRPQSFAEIVGQNHVKITLEHEIKSGRVAHAYLFCGPRAVGKTTIARLLAKAVNCQNRKDDEAEPCGKCESCLDIAAGKSMDVVEMDAASHTGVDNIRENVIAASRVAPSRTKYKVFIIDEVHMLSLSAFNSLLKIIEEPPQYVIFILCTTEVHKVPATVISRCQRFDFKRFSVNETTTKLQEIASKEGIKIDKKILESIARHAEGHMRDAESLLGQIVSVGGKEITPEEADLVIPRSDLAEAINLLAKLGRRDAAGAIGLVNSLLDGGIDLGRFLSDTIQIARKMMLAKINPSLSERIGLELGESMELKISEAGQEMSLPRLLAVIDKLLRARIEMKNSFMTQLPVEIAIVELCSEPVQASVRPGVQPGTPPQRANPGQQQVQDKPAQPQAKSDLSGPAAITTEEISSRWHEVLAKVKKHNHSLVFILRACQPKSVAGNTITLVFKYKFHKERIKETNIKNMVESVLREVYGKPLSIEADIDEKLDIGVNGNNGYSEPEAEESAKGDEPEGQAQESVEKQGGEKNPMVDNLLKTFGGRVVE